MCGQITNLDRQKGGVQFLPVLLKPLNEKNHKFRSNFLGSPFSSPCFVCTAPSHAAAEDSGRSLLPGSEQEENSLSDNNGEEPCHNTAVSFWSPSHPFCYCHQNKPPITGKWLLRDRQPALTIGQLRRNKATAPLRRMGRGDLTLESFVYFVVDSGIQTSLLIMLDCPLDIFMIACEKLPCVRHPDQATFFCKDLP